MIYQFGLQPDVPAAVPASSGGDLLIPTIILISVGILLIIVALLFVIRFFIHRTSVASNNTFHRTTVLVTIPKFRRQEESERGPSKDQVHETIAAAEQFFSAIGGMTAERGLRA